MARPKGTTRPGIKYLSPKEWRRFQEEVRQDAMYRFLFDLMFTIAGRVTEVCNLRLSAIDEREHQIQVQGAKGGLLNRYPMDIPLWHRYQCWKKERAQLLGPLQAPWLFPSMDSTLRAQGQALTEQAVKYRFKQVILHLGLNLELSVHALRHTAAISLLRAGVPAVEIQKHLRQRTSDSVMKYLALFGQEAQEAAEKRMAVLQKYVK